MLMSAAVLSTAVLQLLKDSSSCLSLSGIVLEVGLMLHWFKVSIPKKPKPSSRKKEKRRLMGILTATVVGMVVLVLLVSGGCPLAFPRHRKLLSPSGGAMENKEEPNRIWGEKCTTSDIVINQGQTSPLPSGIPTYTVEITNLCVSGCDITRIHISCGWFSSARLINPRVFKRLGYNDCLVNDGKPLLNGATLSFQYANTYSYPLSVSSVVCP